MHRIRSLFAILIIASLALTTSAQMATAQTASPIAVPTVTSTGCDQIPAYVEARQKIMKDMLIGLEVIFPTVATPIADHGDQLVGAMMVMTAEQAGRLGKLYDITADEIARLDVPEIARFYNQQVADLYRMSGKVFAEAETTGLATAGEKYGQQLDAIATAMGLYGASAIAVCPDFAGVTKIDQTQIGD